MLPPELPPRSCCFPANGRDHIRRPKDRSTLNACQAAERNMEPSHGPIDVPSLPAREPPSMWIDPRQQITDAKRFASRANEGAGELALKLAQAARLARPKQPWASRRACGGLIFPRHSDQANILGEHEHWRTLFGDVHTNMANIFPRNVRYVRHRAWKVVQLIGHACSFHAPTRPPSPISHSDARWNAFWRARSSPVLIPAE